MEKEPKEDNYNFLIVNILNKNKIPNAANIKITKIKIKIPKKINKIIKTGKIKAINTLYFKLIKGLPFMLNSLSFINKKKDANKAR